VVKEKNRAKDACFSKWRPEPIPTRDVTRWSYVTEIFPNTESVDLGIRYESNTHWVNARPCGCMDKPRTPHLLRRSFEMGASRADHVALDGDEYPGSAGYRFDRHAV
jgi:hypothetical protein